MRRLRCSFQVESNIPGGPLVIRDQGIGMTVTNDAEAVVEYLAGGTALTPGRKLYYYDTEGELAELKVEDGKFAGFGFPPKNIQF